MLSNDMNYKRVELKILEEFAKIAFNGLLLKSMDKYRSGIGDGTNFDRLAQDSYVAAKAMMTARRKYCRWYLVDGAGEGDEG